MKYKIANINLNFDGIEFSCFENRMKQYVSPNTTDVDVNITYFNKQIITLPEGTTIDKVDKWNWMITKDNNYAAYQVHPGTKEIISLVETDKEWKNINLHLMEFDNKLDITNQRRCFVCAGMIFAYSILKNNGIVLHSSAIDYNGNAILFSAPSGTGKSTHTSLWKKYYSDNTTIINDDTPAIRIVDDATLAFGTPWSGKTDINCNRSVPLKAIVFIERSSENKMKKINGVEAISLILNETRKSVYPEMMNLSLDMINKLISNTPIYLLSCNISREAVDLVKSTLDL